MASSFTTLGIEKMATGENAGTWGDKTNTNLDIVNTAIAGYVEQSIAGGAATTALSITDGAATSTAQNAVIKLTGTISGNQIVTVPDSVEKIYIVTNGTSGAHTVQFKTASGSGITFGVSEKTTKLFYSDGTNIVDAGFSGGTDLDGKELVLDADGDTSLTADTDDQIDIRIAGTDQLTIKDGALSPVTNNDIDLGTSSLEFKDAFFDGTVTADAFAGPLTGNVTGNASGTAATVTTAAQSNITSLGTLTTLTVDDITINGSTISDAGDFTLDVEGDIILDANGADVFLKDAGTTYGSLTNTSGNLIVKSGTTTALTFSGADVTIAGDLTISGDDLTMATNTAGHLLIADGTNFNPVAVTDLSAISTVASGDTLLAVDASGGGLKKIARSVLVAGLATSSAISDIIEDTSPQLGGNLDTNSQNILIDDAHFIADESGNEQIIFQTTGSAVNQFDVTNAASGAGPRLSATGGDSNIDLDILAKGTGHVTVRGNTTSGTIQFNCESNSHGQIIRAQPHSASATNIMLLPEGADSTLVSLVSTDTLTNKTLTSPKINEDVAVTSTATELNLLDGKTATNLALTGKLGGTNFTNSLIVGHATTGTLNAADGNTAVGINAMDAITTGDDNVVIGLNAGTAMTTAKRSVLIGHLAGTSLDTGFSNTAVGRNALPAGTSAHSNMALGQNALQAVNTGDYNLGIGRDSGNNITSGNGNVVIGQADVASATGDRQLSISGFDGTNTTTWISGDSDGDLTFAHDIFLADDSFIQFGGASETISGDGTDLVISANNLTVDAAADIILDAGGNDFQFKSGGTHVLSVTNSSSDVIIKPIVDAKDIIFQQRDGTEVARIEDNATFNVSTAGKFAYAGTAVTATAAELNLSDLATLGTSAASKVLSADANNLTKVSGGIVLVEATLSFDATQDWDVRVSPVAKVVLTANVTFDAPSNPTAGQFISILAIQDSGGSNTIAWNAVFEFPGETAPVATTTGAKGDLFSFRYNGTKWVEVGRNLNLTVA